MSSRAEQREKTRQAILQSALDLASEEGLAALSLREVTRRAGVAPATFYRYFVDMDDLGLALVDQVGMTLRQMMRQARHRVKVSGSVVRTSIDTFMEFIDHSPQLFRLLLADRTGGPKAIREELQKEKQRFIDELTDDLLRDVEGRPPTLAHIPVVAEMMVNLVFDGGVEAINLSRQERKDLAEKLVLELRIIVAGSRTLALLGKKNNTED